MVRNTMKIESGEKELENAVFEPKLTRSKAKELRQTVNIFSFFFLLKAFINKCFVLTIDVF